MPLQGALGYYLINKSPFATMGYLWNINYVCYGWEGDNSCIVHITGTLFMAYKGEHHLISHTSLFTGVGEFSSFCGSRVSQSWWGLQTTSLKTRRNTDRCNKLSHFNAESLNRRGCYILLACLACHLAKKNHFEQFKTEEKKERK